MLPSPPAGDVLDAVKLSRQDALLGNYSSSLTNFDDVLDKINKSATSLSHATPTHKLPLPHPPNPPTHCSFIAVRASLVCSASYRASTTLCNDRSGCIVVTSYTRRYHSCATSSIRSQPSSSHPSHSTGPTPTTRPSSTKSRLRPTSIETSGRHRPQLHPRVERRRSG